MQRTVFFENIPPRLTGEFGWALYTTRKYPIKSQAVRYGFPYKTQNEKSFAASNDVATLSSFQDAWEAFTINPSDAVVGPAFAVRKRIGVLFIDLDDPAKRHLDPDKLALVKEMHREFMALGRQSFAEISSSGNGVHVFIEGTMPDGMYDLFGCGGVYSDAQFAYMTGRLLPGTTLEITNCQAQFDAIITKYLSLGVITLKDRSLDPKALDGAELSFLESRSTAFYRVLDKSDDEVLECLFRFPATKARYEGALASGDYSEEARNLVGDLDKITGDPQQVERIVFSSPLYRDATPRRQDTNRRMFNRRLITCRMDTNRDYERGRFTPQNSAAAYFEGKALRERMEAASEAKSAEIAYAFSVATGEPAGDELAQLAAAALEADKESKRDALLSEIDAEVAADEYIAGGTPIYASKELAALSAAAVTFRRSIAEACPELDFALSIPPGFARVLCEEVGQGTIDPQPRYIVPSVIFGLSSLVGRRYKVHGKGVCVSHIVTGHSNTGKSSTARTMMNFFKSAISGAMANPDNMREVFNHPTQRVDSFDPFIDEDIASQQAMLLTFFHTPTGGWFVDEAAGLVAKLSSEVNAQTATSSIIPMWKMTFENSSAMGCIKAPRSMEGLKSKLKYHPVYNVGVASYITTQTNFLSNLTETQIHDGLLSRTLILHNDESLNPDVDTYALDSLRLALSAPVASRVRTLAHLGRELDMVYLAASRKDDPEEIRTITPRALASISKDHLVEIGFSVTAAELLQRATKATKDIAKDAQDGKVTPWAEILSRATELAARVAGVLAVADAIPAHDVTKSFASKALPRPVISEAQLVWSLNYVLFMHLSLISASERGQVATDIEGIDDIILDAMAAIITDRRTSVPEWELRRRVRSPLSTIAKKGPPGTSSNKLFESAMRGLKENGFLRLAAGTRADSKNVTINADHKYWKLRLGAEVRFHRKSKKEKLAEQAQKNGP